MDIRTLPLLEALSWRDLDPHTCDDSELIDALVSHLMLDGKWLSEEAEDIVYDDLDWPSLLLQAASVGYASMIGTDHAMVERAQLGDCVLAGIRRGLTAFCHAMAGELRIEAIQQDREAHAA